MLFVIQSNTTSGDRHPLALTNNGSAITVTELLPGMTPSPQQLWRPYWVGEGLTVFLNQASGRLLHYAAWNRPADTVGDDAANIVPPPDGSNQPCCTMSVVGPNDRLMIRASSPGRHDQNLNVFGNWPYDNNSVVGFYEYSGHKGGEDNETWQLVYQSPGG